LCSSQRNYSWRYRNYGNDSVLIVMDDLKRVRERVMPKTREILSLSIVVVGVCVVYES